MIGTLAGEDIEDFGNGPQALATAFLWRLYLDSRYRHGLSVDPPVLELMANLIGFDPQVVKSSLSLRDTASHKEVRWLQRLPIT